MTLTIKDSPESNSSGQSPRSNPVCLELAVTIRSLPTEAGGLAQPIREEAKTVIVFDNGAVLRSTSNLPIGQTVIVSNPSGRDVVCRVVGGRNLPSVKGYVEVEFIEPVKDFWGIHQDADTVAAAAPPVSPLGTREAAAPPPLAPSRPVAPLEPPANSANSSLGSGPTFEDIPGLFSKASSASKRESKTQSAGSGSEKITKDDSDYNSEFAQPTSVANWRPPESELPPEKRAIAAMRDALSTTSSTPRTSRDFMGKGLMAYEKPRPSSSGSNGRMPLILGAAALVLAGVGAVVFFMHQGTAPFSSFAKTDVVTRPSVPEPQAAKSAPPHVQSAKEESAKVATPAQTKAQAEQVAVDQAQPMASLAPVPAVVTSSETPQSRTEAGNVRRQAENTVVTKQPSLSSSRRSAMPNLKIGSPTAPNHHPADLGEGAAPMTDIASTEAVGGTPPAGLLTSAGRTSAPPAPPPSALTPAPAVAPAPAPVVAAKAVVDPKLISSTRLVYPTAARQSNIQGSVTVSATIDEKGRVVGAKALSGPMLLRQAAEESVSQWKYSPGLVDGKPTASQVNVTVEFRLN